MRIDDENKVVWCNEELLDWYESYEKEPNKINFMIYHVARTGFGHGLTNKKNITLNLSVWKDINKQSLIIAILNGYKFKLEQPQKYYWRKKKEYLAWFEKQENCYLSKDFIGQIKLSNLDDEGAYKYFKFTEDFARDILKDDFDKFEKVECE